MTDLKKYQNDFQVLDHLANETAKLWDWLNDNRSKCLDTTQPTMNNIANGLREVVNIADTRLEQVKEEFAKLVEIEEAKDRLEKRLKGIKIDQ